MTGRERGPTPGPVPSPSPTRAPSTPPVPQTMVGSGAPHRRMPGATLSQVPPRPHTPGHWGRCAPRELAQTTFSNLTATCDGSQFYTCTAEVLPSITPTS